MNKQVFSVFMAVLFSMNVFSQSKTPTDKTVFWEITPKNGGKPSYLYGTMHVSKKLAFRLPNSFYDAIKKADVVALESNPEMWSQELDQAPDLRDLFSLMNIGYNSWMGRQSSYYGRSYGLFPVSNDLIKQQLSYEPHSVNDLLFRSYGMQQNFEEDTYLDLYIFKTGKKYGKPIASLEDVVWSTITVLKASTAEENKHSGQVYTGNLDEDMEDAYREQDLVKLDSIQRAASPSEKYIEGLLYIRNDTMFKNIEAQIKQGKSIFAAVGAAHLAGDKGLLLRFMKEGYQVKPILDASRLDPSSKINALDSVYLPVTYTRKYSQDSTLSFMAPVYTARSVVGGRVEYLSSDMTNGVYYHVSRISSMLSLSGLTQTRIEEKFDSLLFEYTEGTILSKKKLMVQNFPSLQVTSKTKDGKLNKQLIVITPLEIILAKVVGKENYFQQQNTDTFFHGLNIQYKKSQGELFFSDFHLKMPMSLSDNPFGSYNFNGPTLLVQGLDEEGDYFQVLRNYCVRQVEHEEDTFHLNMYAYFMARTFKLKIKEQKNIVQNGLPAVNVIFQNDQKKKIYARIIQRGSSVYFLTACTANRTKAEAMFNSFSILNDMRGAAKWYHDSEQHYMFRTHLQPVGGALRKELFSQFQNSEEYNPRKPVYTAVFADTSFGYQLTIGVEELNKFEAYPTVDSFWNTFYRDHFELDPEIEKKHLVIDHKTWLENQQHYMQVNLRGEHSQNISHYLYVLNGNKLLICQTFRDSTQINYRFADTVLRSLQFEKPAAPSLLSSALDTFMVYMTSRDSAMKDYFTRQSSQLCLLDQDEKRLMALLDTSEVLKKKDEMYMQLLGYLVNYKKPSTLDFIRTLYRRNEDNLDRQNAILGIVAGMNDTASTLLFKDLILEEPPLEFESDDSPLTHYYDTLTLARLLFPELKQLMDLDDYKWDVIYFMDDLLKDGKIDSAMYADKVNYFVIKGKEEIRRKTAQKSSLEEEQDKMEDVEEEDKTSNTWSNIGSDFFLSEEKDNYNSILNFSEFYLLKSFARLLTPYRERVNVKEFFSKMDSTSNMDLRFDLAIENMKNKKPFDSLVVRDYAELSKYRYKIIHDFYFNEAIQKLPFNISGQQEVARSKIMEEIELKPGDTLSYVDKLWVRGRKDQGYIYIFKHKKEKDKKYLYDFMGLFEKDTKKWLPENSILRCNIDMEKKNFSELQEQLMSQFRVMDRIFIQPNDMIESEETD